MALFNDSEVAKLKISRMVFHVVGRDPPDDDAVLLKEICPIVFEDFFIERVKSALKGNLFSFRDGSQVGALLQQIANDPERFQVNSEQLARNFQRFHSGSTSPGVLFLFQLCIESSSDTCFALIKYEHEDVVGYEIKDGAAVLERMKHTFVRKSDALQKIALLRISASGELSDVVVRDRSAPNGISGYFSGFLEVRRINDVAKLSEKLVDAVVSTFKEHKGSLSPLIAAGGVGDVLRKLASTPLTFGPEHQDGLCLLVFGDSSESASVRKSLNSKLKKLGIDEETFELDATKVRRPPRRRMITEEDIHVIYPSELKPRIETSGDGRAQIIIETSGVKSDDVESDGSRRSN